MSKDNGNKYVYVLLPAQKPDGAHILGAVVKRTYDINTDGSCTPSAEQAPLVTADKFYEGKDPLTASCLMESDFIPYKAATDVVVIGKAHAPGGLPTREVRVSVGVGNVTKTIVVFGDRRCTYSRQHGAIFSDPQPFQQMEIRYERAYGGVDLASYGAEAPMIYPRNPLGKGFIIKATKEVIDGLVLPNLEDPQHLLTPGTLSTGKMEEWQKQPMPQGFGWYGKLWYPRCSYAGVLPAYMSLYEEIQEAALGLVPKDQVEQFKKFRMPILDFRFFNGASPPLAMPFLKGNEVVRTVNLGPEGMFELALPGTTPKLSIDIGNGPQNPDVVLHTVCILKEDRRMYLVWRGAIEYPGPEKPGAITKMELTVEEG